ncbi:hypothetical protein PV08_03796 [Exophiala spinifera]|uniref:25S rRNA (uridine-N(3))-methyltransferase BMT5-like domain-containing protein n=1 Tax=Exophiala spinifera TaxID=91928 RepID=A0A0D2BCB1_9EURO|nr:uncharacterized protein PV08_03796 [Exophiala spinifera]KIW16608.1 hypothetical protein PV08_03796 [Exophiala spinifera]
MGKVKRQAQKHSNHHDNPRKGATSISRRQHSQKPPTIVKKAASKPVSHDNLQGRLKVPFTKFDNVLLVGEGDFSFSLSLKQHHKVNQITATCYDSKEALESKYPSVAQTVRRLAGSSHEFPTKEIPGDDSDSTKADVHVGGEDTEWNGFSPPPLSPSPASPGDEAGETTSKIPKVNLLYGVDATKLLSTHKKALRPYGPFTKIVFNFPHVGGLSTDVNRQVRYNQELLVGFLKGAKDLLSTPARPAKVIKSETYDEDDELDEAEVSDNETRRDPGAVSGQILVTLFEGEPYTLWNIRDLARHSGLKVIESFKFPWSAYPGYQHARTIGDITTGKDRSEQGKRKGAWRGEERDARCYVLEDKDAETSGQASKKRKRRDHDSDGDDGD